MYRNRKHWGFRIGPLVIDRWCPGAPCSIKGVKYERHWIRMWWR
jgi:hypothetical protein